MCPVWFDGLGLYFVGECGPEVVEILFAAFLGEVQTGTRRAEEGGATLQSLSRLVIYTTAGATRVVDLLKGYFSGEGQVSWQWQMVP